MASYQDDELQTLGDILPRMKPLPDPPPGASEDEQARTQQHNDSLAQLQSNALVARYLAQSTIAQGVPFPDSLLHFVPGRLAGQLAAARAGGISNPWADPPSIDISNDATDPWTSYGRSAFAAGAQNSNVTMPPASGNAPSFAAAPTRPATPAATQPPEHSIGAYMRRAADNAWDYAMGTETDPTPERLGVEYFTGTGPETRVLDESSRFSQEFKNGPAALAFENYLLDKYQGAPPEGGSVTKFGWKFTAPRFASTGNPAQHFVGSVKDGTATVSNGVAHFAVNNDSSAESLFYGRPLEDMGLPPPVNAYPRWIWAPGGTTSQTIKWATPVAKLGRRD